MQSIKPSDIYMTAALAGLLTVCSLPASAESKVMTNSAGMTVYTFDKDSAGKSACYGDCATAWPPVSAESMPAGTNISIIARADGTRQATLQGKPLYLFASDKKPGDMTGDNVQNVWHALSADGKPVAVGAQKSGYSSGYSYGY